MGRYGRETAHSLEGIDGRSGAQDGGFLWPHLHDAVDNHDNKSNGNTNITNLEGRRREDGEVGLGYHVVFVNSGLCTSREVAAMLMGNEGRKNLGSPT